MGESVHEYWDLLPGCTLGGDLVLGGASVVLYMAVSKRSQDKK